MNVNVNVTPVKGHITGLFYYPVKSCLGITASSVAIEERGIKYDRQWAVANAQGQALTQRELSQMALIEARVNDNGTLTLKAPGRASCEMSAGNSTTSTTIEVWGNRYTGFDEGDRVADWLEAFLGMQCRLVRVNPDNDRQCVVNLPDGKPVRLSFVDGCSFLVISQESLADLNDRMSQPVPMERFRPNIVISGLGAFAEDACRELQIGTVTLHKVQSCERCVITTIDQSSAIKGVEPMKTLSAYRRSGKKVIFGTYFLHAQSGQINIGDEVTAVLERGVPS